MQPIPTAKSRVLRQGPHTSVEAVVDDGVANVCEVPVDLVLPPSHDPYSSEGERLEAAPRERQGFGQASTLSAAAPGRESLERSLQRPVAVEPTVAKQRVVSLQVPRVELQLQIVESLVCRCQQDKARARHVQAVQKPVPVCGISEDACAFAEGGLGKVQKLHRCLPIADTRARIFGQNVTIRGVVWFLPATFVAKVATAT